VAAALNRREGRNPPLIRLDDIDTGNGELAPAERRES
jgi:hypothetical protein